MTTEQKEKAVTGQYNQAAEQEQEQTPEEDTPAKRKEAKQAKRATRKAQKKERKQEKRQHKKPRRRIFPIYLRIVVVLVLSAAALAAGAMVGYGVFGDGNPTDALKWETWQHMIDIVTKKK